MVNIIGAGVTIEGIADSEFVFTFNAASDIQTLYNSNMTGYGWNAQTTDPIGLAVTQDTTASNQVRLAAAGDDILGIIMRVENRVSEGIFTVAVRTQGGIRFKAATAYASPALGDRLTGDGTQHGYVNKATAPTGATADQWPGRAQVYEVGTLGTADGTVVALVR